MYLYSEAEIRARDTQWMMERLQPERVDYCEEEARRLTAMGLTDESTGELIPYEEWLFAVVRSIYQIDEARWGRLCGEIGED